MKHKTLTADELAALKAFAELHGLRAERSDCVQIGGEVMATATAYTPGPWFHAPLSDDICTMRGVPVACPHEGYDEAQWAANARLIAAAPELLAALSAFVEFADYYLIDMDEDDASNATEMIADARALLAKAEGR